MHSSVDLQTCRSYTVYDSIDVKGIAIRSEKILSQDTSGYVYYTLENGARVAKDGVIAEIYPTEDDALKQKKLKEIKEEIKNLQTLQEQGSVSKTNLETLNAQIVSTQSDMLSKFYLGDYMDLSEQRASLMEFLNRKQILTTKITDFKDYIEKLKDQKEALEASSFSKATGTITSPDPGYFVSTLDGFESVFSYKDVETLTVEKINEAFSMKPELDSSHSVGKVVSNYEWYIACVVPTDRLNSINEGNDINVKFPFISDEAIPVEIVSINRDKENAAVILKCSYMSEALSSIRCEELQILLTEYSGLYVPDEALQFDKENNPGVFICTGTTLEFRKIVILHHSDIGKYSICDATAGTAKLATSSKTESSQTEESAIDSSQPEESLEETSLEESHPEDNSEIQNPAEYLKLYDDIVVGGKNLYEGKIVR